ncbi:MAG: hypothetical protein WBV94_34605 [Blastocatellia bacterium]
MNQNRLRNSVQPDNKRRFGNVGFKLIGSLVVIVLACCSAVTIVSLARNGPPPASPSASLSSSPRTAQAAGREPTRFVKFNLFDLGIYPRELHVPKGLLSINIEDYSGGSTGLVVTRETDTAPQQVGSVVRGGGGGAGWRGQSEMKLDEGRYIVFMADRPGNRALLVVEP